MKWIEVIIDAGEILDLFLISLVMVKPRRHVILNCLVIWYTILTITDIIFYLALMVAGQMYMAWYFLILVISVKFGLLYCLKLYKMRWQERIYLLKFLKDAQHRNGMAAIMKI